MFFFNLETVTFLSCIATISSQACTPYQTKDKIVSNCNTLNGVVDGTSCFFLTGGDALTANANCQQSGSVLAQIQTESEYVKIAGYLAGIFGTNDRSGHVWLALQRDFGAVGNCSYTQNTTFWYDDGVKNPNLNVGNTWLRTLACTDPRTPNYSYRCIALNNRLNGSYALFGDGLCSWSITVLCQYRTPNQNYTLTNAPCLAETPIESFAVTQVQECGEVCSQRIWCRSYNFGMYNSDSCNFTCQLFTWSTYDTCTRNCPQTYSNRTSPFSACYRYNYVR